jgi:hypothetical protein
MTQTELTDDRWTEARQMTERTGEGSIVRRRKEAREALNNEPTTFGGW